MIFFFFKAWKRSLFTKLSKSRCKLHQLISVGVETNDGPFLVYRDFSAGDKTLLIKLIAFCSRLVFLASSIILLSFSRYIVLHSLLCNFLKLLFLRRWLKNSNVIYLFCVFFYLSLRLKMIATLFPFWFLHKLCEVH